MDALNITFFGNAANKLRDMTGKLLEYLQVGMEKLTPLTKLPFIGDTVTEVQDVVDMLNDYYYGRYKKVPVTVIIGCVGIVAYLLSPYDIIPDTIPIIGAIDDVFIIEMIMELCVGKELEHYRAWRDEQKS